MRKLLFTALAFFVVGVALPAQQVTRRFTLDDFSKVARVSDPQFAPDGKSIAVVVSRPNLDEDRYDPELTVVDVATKASHTIVKGLERSELRAMVARRNEVRLSRQRGTGRRAEAPGVRRVFERRRADGVDQQPARRAAARVVARLEDDRVRDAG